MNDFFYFLQTTFYTIEPTRKQSEKSKSILLATIYTARTSRDNQANRHIKHTWQIVIMPSDLLSMQSLLVVFPPAMTHVMSLLSSCVGFRIWKQPRKIYSQAAIHQQYFW